MDSPGVDASCWIRTTPLGPPGNALGTRNPSFPGFWGLPNTITYSSGYTLIRRYLQHTYKMSLKLSVVFFMLREGVGLSVVLSPSREVKSKAKTTMCWPSSVNLNGFTFLKLLLCLKKLQPLWRVYLYMIFFIFLFYTVFLKVYSYPPRSPSAGEIVHERKYKARKYLFTVDNCICKIQMCFEMIQ